MDSTRLRLVLCAAALLANGCSPAYLWQAAAGQWEIMRARRPVTDVIADPATSPELRRRLEVATDALRFAREALALPDNGSYAQFSDLHRVFAVWNVFAAPEFSLAPRTWCFPVAGCVAYRGYFRERAAHDYAKRLLDRGEDVFVGGVAAYSTLGYLDDPLLSTALVVPDWQMAGLLFHELAHQKVYVADDTTFDESFAMLVEEEGVRRWLTARDDYAGLAAFEQEYRLRRERRALLDRLRTELGAVYASPAAPEEKRERKKIVLSAYQASLRELLDGANHEVVLNNAALAALSVYDEELPAFHALLRQSGGKLAEFYERAARLGRSPERERRDALTALLVSESATRGPDSHVAPTVSAGTAVSKLPAVP